MSTFMDELIPPVDPAPSPLGAPEPRRSASVVCEFCECQLAPDGGVMKMSENARGTVKLKDRLASVAADLEAAHADLARAQAEIAQLKAAAAPSQSGHIFDLRR
jgi:hypothetical protein